MRMTKKVTAMALASMMALSLAGCGGSSSTTATTAAATEAAKETTAAATEAAKEAATTAAAAGTVTAAAPVANATDSENVVNQFNELLANLRTAGLLAPNP